MYFALLLTCLSLLYSNIPVCANDPLPIPVAQKRFSFINVQASLPDDRVMVIVLKPQMAPPITVQLRPEKGKIDWKSHPLMPGPYLITYILPHQYTPLPPTQVVLAPGQNVHLSPNLQLAPQTTSLQVIANIAEAIFLVRSSKSSQVWKGEGREYTASDLPAGNYTLTLSTTEPDFYLPPPDTHFYLNEHENKVLKVTYQVAGKLTIKTNVAHSLVTIQEINGKKKTSQGELFDHSKTFTLPEGRYRITLIPSANEAVSTTKLFPPEPVEVNVRALASENITLTYKSSNAPTEKPRKIIVTTNQTDYSPIQQTVAIPAGKAIIGDALTDEKINERPAKIVTISPFTIGTYEVTNALYATWLNQALKADKISYVEEADNRGQVLDMQGRLLFKTFTADPYSQISAHMQSMEGPTFLSLPGKDLYPVINVSWYGAMAYCQDNNCRLPTEAEWEKAASMQPSSDGAALIKYRFGFSSNTIDPTWANYKDNDRELQYFRVLTTPIGFYNGTNTLPLTIHNSTQQQTHLAKSPYGAFDMSGNVWEWVADWYDDGYYENMSDTDPQGPKDGTKKVVKGGCYDSLADGVRVTERFGLLPDHTDAYTGFRIAK